MLELGVIISYRVKNRNGWSGGIEAIERMVYKSGLTPNSFGSKTCRTTQIITMIPDAIKRNEYGVMDRPIAEISMKVFMDNSMVISPKKNTVNGTRILNSFSRLLS